MPIDLDLLLEAVEFHLEPVEFLELLLVVSQVGTLGVFLGPQGFQLGFVAEKLRLQGLVDGVHAAAGLAVAPGLLHG